MSEFDEIMEQHNKKGTRKLQSIVQDEMSKMDERLDRIASEVPAFKAVQDYMEKEGLAFLMQGGKFNTDWLAEKIGHPVAQVKEAMKVYSQHLNTVFENAKTRYPGRVPWESFERVRSSGR